MPDKDLSVLSGSRYTGTSRDLFEGDFWLAVVKMEKVCTGASAMHTFG